MYVYIYIYIFFFFFPFGNWIDWILGVAEVGIWRLMWWLMAILCKRFGPWLMWLNQGHWVFFGFLCKEHEDFPFGFLGIQTLNGDETLFSFTF